MKLYQKPPDVDMGTVYELIYELEMRMFGEAFYHAGSHRTDPLSIDTRPICALCDKPFDKGHNCGNRKYPPARRGLRGEPIEIRRQKRDIELALNGRS